MPECHKCKWNGKGNLQACMNCCAFSSDSLSCHGQNFVSFDSVPDSSFIEQKQLQVEQSEQVTDLPEEIENKLRSFLFELFNLSDENILLVKWVFGGGNLSSFAELHHVSRQHISKLSLKICERVPLLAPLFKRKLNKESGKIEGRFHQDEFYLK